MFNTAQIEEALVRLEERALELSLAQPSDLAKHEYEDLHAEAKRLRPQVDELGREYVLRLDRGQVELMCIRPKLAASTGGKVKVA